MNPETQNKQLKKKSRQLFVDAIEIKLTDEVLNG